MVVFLTILKTILALCAIITTYSIIKHNKTRFFKRRRKIVIPDDTSEPLVTSISSKELERKILGDFGRRYNY